MMCMCFVVIEVCCCVCNSCDFLWLIWCEIGLLVEIIDVEEEVWLVVIFCVFLVSYWIE